MKKVVIRLWDGERNHVLMLLYEARGFEEDKPRKPYWGLPEAKVRQLESPRHAVMRKLEEMGVGAVVSKDHSEVVYLGDKEVFIFDVYNTGQLPNKLDSNVLRSDWVYRYWLIPSHSTYGYHRGDRIARNHICYITGEIATAPR